MIDPLERWAQYGEKPDDAGLLTFGGVPLTRGSAELEGFDVAIVGAPMDDLAPTARAPASRRARSAPSGCPPGPHLEAGVDAFAALGSSTSATRRSCPPTRARTHAAIDAIVGEVVDAGRDPGRARRRPLDHRAVTSARAPAGGPVGLVHFDTHTDTGAEVFGVERLARHARCTGSSRPGS